MKKRNKEIKCTLCKGFAYNLVKCRFFIYCECVNDCTCNMYCYKHEYLSDFTASEIEEIKNKTSSIIQCCDCRKWSKNIKSGLKTCDDCMEKAKTYRDKRKEITAEYYKKSRRLRRERLRRERLGEDDFHKLMAETT